MTEHIKYKLHILTPAFFVLVYFVLSLIGIYHHEVWLDEAHHFLLARDSTDISSLITACRNEGHPLLWNFLLFILTRFTDNVFGMQILHISISCLAVFCISKSRLGIWEKIFILFGYYMFYEYNIISRNYGIGALFFFMLINTYCRNEKDILKMALLIFLLANTHLFSLLLSVAFVFTYITYNRKFLSGIKKNKIITSVIIIITGWLISAYFIIPPADYAHSFLKFDSSAYFSDQRILKTLSVPFKGIFYVPDYIAAANHYEDSLYYKRFHLSILTQYIIFAAAILIPLILLRKNRFAFVLFLSYMLLYLGAYYFLPLAHGTRYFGFFYLIFTGCYCIARPQLSKNQLKLGFCIFLLQFINGIFFYTKDIRLNYSQSKNVGQFLMQQKIDPENVLIITETLRPAISAYTGDTYFGMENGLASSYIHWDIYAGDSIRQERINNFLSSKDSTIIITNSELTFVTDTAKLQKLKSYSGGILKSEDANIFLYKK